jgi:hypothetical protein
MRKMTAGTRFTAVLAVIGILWAVWRIAFPQTAFGLTTQEIEQIVEQFYPQRLVDDSSARVQRGGPAPFRAKAFEVADLDGTGTANYIVAAYTNGFRAAIRVLKLQDGTAILVAETNLRLLGGIFPAVKLVDIENDGRPEVAIYLSEARASTFDWVFKWTGAELRLIGPASVDENGDVFTDLGDSGFFDVDGDGTLEIVQGPLNATEVYRFDGQKFSLSKTLSLFDTFYRREGIPILQRSEFEVANPVGGFVLTIVNGDRNGDNRVSSGTVRLNGVQVLSPNNLNQKVRKVVRQVTVLANNVLEVELQSKPSGQILVTVEPPPR